MEHIIDQADPEYTYCDTSIYVHPDTQLVTVDEIDHSVVCVKCIQAFRNRY